MPNATSFAEARQLARELAPTLARISRAAPPAPITGRAIDARSHHKDNSRHGQLSAHVRRYCDLPEPRPTPADYAARHNLRPDSFLVLCAIEQRLRRDPAAVAARRIVEDAARDFLRAHPQFTLEQRAAFARARDIPPGEFRHAVRRVGQILLLAATLDHAHAA